MLTGAQTWWVTTSPGESPVAAGRHGRLLLDGTADPPQVPPEGVGRFGCPPRQVFTEGCLLAQGLTRLDLTGLIPLDLANLPGCGQDLPSEFRFCGYCGTPLVATSRKARRT